MNTKKACVVGLVLAASSVASAGTYYISPEYGDDDNGDGLSMATAFRSLSKVFGEDGKARGNLAEGSTVVLSNGTYALDVPLELYRTTLKGWTGNPKDVILDGQDEVNCVMVKTDDGACTLSGVTVMRGKPWGPFVNQVFYGGAGVYIGQSSSVVTNCIVRDCTQPLSGVTFLMGGGVMVTAGKVVDTYVENCHVRPPEGGRGYGGGICLYGSSTSAENCTVTNCSIVATAEAYGGGIGNYFEGYDPKVTGCVVVDCALTNSAGVAAGTGGGISVTPGGEIRDCLVRNCTGGQAQVALVGRNGTDYAVHKSLVSGCTIEGGTCRPLYVGCSSAISNATVENTLIRDVAWTPSSSSTYGYGILVSGSNNQILSTVVRNCESVGNNGAHAVYIGADTVVSNCVVEQCKTLSDSGTAQYSGAIAAQFVTGLQIVDSIIQSNEAYRSSSAYVYGNGGTATGLVVRGCYFFANKSRNTCGIYAADNRPHIFDHCTFAGNMGGEYFRATGFGGPRGELVYQRLRLRGRQMLSVRL